MVAPCHGRDMGNMPRFLLPPTLLALPGRRGRRLAIVANLGRRFLLFQTRTGADSRGGPSGGVVRRRGALCRLVLAHTFAGRGLTLGTGSVDLGTTFTTLLRCLSCLPSEVGYPCLCAFNSLL